MSESLFRMVTEKDVPSILAIYEPYVRETAITFEVAVPSQHEFSRRIASIAAEYPYIVCESAGRIIGYAYAHRHMERAAYQWNAELSVYMDRDYHGRGVGKLLYLAVMELLKHQQVRNVYGGVTMPNEKSERLHHSLGFVPMGAFHTTGYKCGAWHDVAWFEKSIGPYSKDPEPFVPISQIDLSLVREILQKFSMIGK